jgi:hypothetical protein
LASPNLIDGKNKMAKKVIKADKADEKVGQLTGKDKKDDKKKTRSAKEVRSKLYGSDE